MSWDLLTQTHVYTAGSQIPSLMRLHLHLFRRLLDLPPRSKLTLCSIRGLHGCGCKEIR